MITDKLKIEREHYAKWKERYPQFAHLSAIDVLGELKKRGHVRNIVLVNGLPRSVSTILTKALAESPSLDMQNFPIMHEVLNDSGSTWRYKDEKDHEGTYVRRCDAEGYKGSDVLIGKLLDGGILEHQNVDLVLKTMSHELTGDDLKEMLPHLNNVVSTLRVPAIHIGCVAQKIVQENPDDVIVTRDIFPPMLRYWNAFNDNMDIMDKWKTDHPDQKFNHVLVNGDVFLRQPDQVLAKICRTFHWRYDKKMTERLSKPVYFSYYDGWGHKEIQAKKVEFGLRHPVPAHHQELRDMVGNSYLPLYDKLLPIFSHITEKHPTVVGNWTDDGVNVPPSQRDSFFLG